MKSSFRLLAMFLACCIAFPLSALQACTGITLKARDGAVLYGRTVEWGAFELHSRLVVVPRGHAFIGHTPDGKPGLQWKSKYGVVGIDALKKDILIDGMNEAGLAVGVFYHAGYAEYSAYDPQQAAVSLGPTDVSKFLLTTCVSVDDVRVAIAKVRVSPIVEPALGFPAPIHLIVTEPSGKAIVIEFLKGQTVIYDNPLGVITNSPTFDWHLTNLRNYINLSPVGLPEKSIDQLDFKPLGAGSGMIGLPGDFTPPSRFVRAVALSKTARATTDGPETLYELFRVLDSFNVPLGAAEGSDENKAKKDDAGMRSATLWTSAADAKNRVYYYHTQHNRRVRKVDLTKIDFGSFEQVVLQPLDRNKDQDIEDVTPR